MAKPKLRDGETPGTGVIVIGRTNHGTLEQAKDQRPFEHASLTVAALEADRLKGKHPEKDFEIWGRIDLGAGK